MTRHTRDTEGLAKRVAHLERTARLQRLALLATGGALVLALLMGQARPKSIPAANRPAIEAERFLVVGPDGKACAILGTWKDRPGLYLLDAAENVRAELSVMAYGSPTLKFYDAKGKVEFVAPRPERRDVGRRQAPDASKAEEAGQAEGPEANAAEAADGAHVTVYVTKSGTKYHRRGCAYLTSSARPIPLSEAVKRYEPCKHCNPPKP
jgi:hypothetical protein